MACLMNDEIENKKIYKSFFGYVRQEQYTKRFEDLYRQL